VEQETKIVAEDGKQLASKPTLESPSKLIDARIKELPDWRGEMLSWIRRLIKQADPEVVEEVKWRKPSNPLGVPVWSHDGIICTGETYKNHVKLTFARGASLKDPAGLFNASLEGNARRAIDLHEGDVINERAFKSLVRAAAALNSSSARAKPKGTANQGERSTATKGEGPSSAEKPKLLSGGNPQIAKADGDAPVQAYIAAMPGWKRDVGRRLEELIVRTVPNVRKAMRWNSPFYGIESQGWFLSYHCFTKYVKVVFLRGMFLRPLPPVESKDPNTRYFHIHEDDQLDEELVASWIKQASELPGDPLF
jgi:hypothetical protein